MQYISEEDSETQRENVLEAQGLQDRGRSKEGRRKRNTVEKQE